MSRPIPLTAGFYIAGPATESLGYRRTPVSSLDNQGNWGAYSGHASLYKLDTIMEDTRNQIPFTDHDTPAEEDNGLDPVLGSGFEEEQPETDFDERI
jgi:hypothetical protein